MALKSEEINKLKQYLLAELTPEECETIEQRLLTDDNYFEEFELAKEELIDLYAEGEMNPQERDRFQKNFLTTSDRRDSLELAQTLTRYSRSQPRNEIKKPGSIWQSFVWPRFVATPLRIAACLLVAIGIAIAGVFIYFRRPNNTEKGLLALNNAYRLERPIEARLSDFQHAPFANKRSGEPVQFDARSRRLAEVMLESAVDGDPGAASLHALGKLDLYEERFNEAIGHFEQALNTDPNNARLHNDVGAAWLERGELELQSGQEGASSESFAKSLGHLERALQIDPNLLEALFNRALVRERLKLFQLAEQDWKAYLEKDSSSPWADEARKKLKSLGERSNKVSETPEQMLQSFLAARQNNDDKTAWKLLAQNRSYKGNFIANRLLDEYLKSATEGRTTEARDKLQVLTYAGELEVSMAKDRFISDLARTYAEASPEVRVSLREARRLTSLGHTYLDKDETSAALERYREVRRVFEQYGDTCESLLVRYASAHSHLLQGESKQSLDEFEAIKSVAEARSYRWLYGQILNALANVHIGLNDYSLSLELSQQSLQVLEDVEDIVGVVKNYDQLGAEYLRLGNPREALKFHRRAIALANENSLPAGPRWRSYFLAAIPFHSLGLTAAAIDLTTEALRCAEETKSISSISRTYAHLGVMYGSGGKYAEALSYVQRAVDAGKTVEAERLRTTTVGYALLQKAALNKLAGNFADAIENYNEVIGLFDQLQFSAFSYVAHKGKLLSCMAQREMCPSIEQELQTTIGLYEDYRSKILETQNRYNFFDTQQGVYDVAIDYEFTTRGDKRTAFDYSERCRARSLLDSASASTAPQGHHTGAHPGPAPSSEPDDLRLIKSELNEKAQIVQYAVLPDKLLIWVISNTVFEGFEQPVSAISLEAKVISYARLIESRSDKDDDERLRASAELYELLIKPVSHLLDGNKLLCVVPDKVLNRLPYASLISAASGEYLIEKYALTFSPSSSMFVRRSDTALERGEAHNEKLLSVGNPAFDRTAFPGFKSLPAAGTEAREVARLYNSPELLTEESASKDRVVRAMERADVIHLATHAVVDPLSPMYSKLLLAKATGNVSGTQDGVLLTSEIYKLNLHARLVVLPACRTGIEQYYGGEGMVGIWSPFITRSVPLVVASLWPVDSDSTKDLMINFHRLRRNGMSSAAALQQAQIEMLRGPDTTYHQPYHWAAFIAIGGQTQF